MNRSWVKHHLEEGGLNPTSVTQAEVDAVNRGETASLTLDIVDVE